MAQTSAGNVGMRMSTYLPLSILGMERFASIYPPHQRKDLEPDQLIHLQSAIHYLVEALKVAQDIKKDMLPIDRSIEKQLGLLHFLEGLCHHRRFESQILTGKIGTRDSMQEMLIFLQNDGTYLLP